MTENSTQQTGSALVHNVFFSLKDDSPTARQQLITACENYLTDHPGTLYFAAGELAADLDRPVNDLNFHVSLHVIFADRKSHDAYQISDRHNQFIAENKETWANVRVFDSNA